jgi:predicted outer membrane repeat protein
MNNLKVENTNFDVRYNVDSLFVFSGETKTFNVNNITLFESLIFNSLFSARKGISSSLDFLQISISNNLLEKYNREDLFFKRVGNLATFSDFKFIKFNNIKVLGFSSLNTDFIKLENIHDTIVINEVHLNKNFLGNFINENLGLIKIESSIYSTNNLQANIMLSNLNISNIFTQNTDNLIQSSNVIKIRGNYSTTIYDSYYFNIATSQSSILNVNSHSLIIENSKFENNTVEDNFDLTQGCAAYISAHKIYIKNTNFIFNNGAYGGAIFISSVRIIRDIYLINNSFMYNSARKDGGAIYFATNIMHDNSQIYLNKFIGNFALRFGGAIYLNYLTPNLINFNKTIFENNLAYSNGGSIYVSKEEEIFKDSSYFKLNFYYCKFFTSEFEKNFSINNLYFDFSSGIFTDTDFSNIKNQIVFDNTIFNVLIDYSHKNIISRSSLYKFNRTNLYMYNSEINYKEYSEISDSPNLVCSNFHLFDIEFSNFRIFQTEISNSFFSNSILKTEFSKIEIDSCIFREINYKCNPFYLSNYDEIYITNTTIGNITNYESQKLITIDYAFIEKKLFHDNIDLLSLNNNIIVNMNNCQVSNIFTHGSLLRIKSFFLKQLFESNLYNLKDLSPRGVLLTNSRLKNPKIMMECLTSFTFNMFESIKDCNSFSIINNNNFKNNTLMSFFKFTDHMNVNLNSNIFEYNTIYEYTISYVTSVCNKKHKIKIIKFFIELRKHILSNLETYFDRDT